MQNVAGISTVVSIICQF